jgi:lipopolysaccharide/colanic/teichoic acid biosynthesis glycosyltransferase
LESWEGERLPELLNVLKGDLAMVGLKPFKAGIESQNPAGMRFDQDGVLAGFTGLWYVQTEEESSCQESEIADAFYLATHRWYDDWQILWSTPAVWYRRSRKRILQDPRGGDGPWKGETSRGEKY